MIPERCDVLIIGGGPAGSLLACLLARRGIDVLLVEKQPTLERSFRGETLIASSLAALRQLGFAAAIDAHGYLQTVGMAMRLEGRDVFRLDYRQATGGGFNVDLPQPALLQIIVAAAAQEPTFHAVNGVTMTELLERDGTVTGAVLRHHDGRRTAVRSRLVVGADGRFSRVRRAARLAARITPMDRDVLWFRVPRPAGWGNWAEFSIDHGRHVLALPTWPDHLRVAVNLPKRGLAAVRQAGFEAFRSDVASLDPRLAPLMRQHLTTFDDTMFLEIFTAELAEWTRDGLVLIGDAAHTCTPILGQGMNMAIQDCVGIAPIIDRALREVPAGRPVPASSFAEFVAARQRHKRRVTRFQTKQEDRLTVDRPLPVALRRLLFRAADATPVKYWVLNRVLGGIHVHPDDQRVEHPSVPHAVLGGNRR